MITVSSRAARGIHVVLTILAVVGLAARIPTIRTAVPRSHGRFNQREIESMSERVCRALAPQIGTILLYTATGETYHEGRPAHRYWTVECSEVDETPVAYLMWNADTGE